MNTCESHDGVFVYTGRNCPVCELVDEHAGCDKEITSLRDRLEDAQSYASDLEES